MAAPVVSAALKARRAAVAVALRRRRAKRAEQEGRARRANGRKLRVMGYGLAILVLAVLLPMTAIILAVASGPDPRAGRSGGVSAAALADIPPEALTAYRDAAATWRVDWSILAGIGKAECDHGRVQLDGCNPPGTMNYAGARGYMQFIGSTWRHGLGQRQLEPRSSPPAADGQGYATDGDGDGDADPWSWADASHAAARYLAAQNVMSDPEQAVFAYNHSQDYVADVMQVAASYRSAEAAGPGSFEGVAGNVPLVRVEGITVHQQIGDQVGALVRAARAQGLTLGGSGYRDPQRQIELRRAHCGSSTYAIYQMPSSQCSPPTARPGKSNHEKGLAIDFTCNGGSIGSHSNACYRWLQANAGAFGLRNLPSEPWHWSIDGT